MNNTSQIICLTGMGRSGTSMMASYLECCDIAMGQNVLEPGRWNRKGFFEDKDFLEFHKKLIAENNGSLYYLNDTEKVKISEDDWSLAQDFISKRSAKSSAWGWKDPRSTLFLDFWSKANSDIKFIFMYRDPFQVVESVYRTMRKHELYLQPWLSPRAWIHYNQRIIDFYDEHSDRCAIVNMHGFEREPEKSAGMMEDWLAVKLTKPFSEVFDPKDRRAGSKKDNPFPIGLWMSFVKISYAKRFENIYARLNERAIIPDCEPALDE